MSDDDLFDGLDMFVEEAREKKAAPSGPKPVTADQAADLLTPVAPRPAAGGPVALSPQQASDLLTPLDPSPTEAEPAAALDPELASRVKAVSEFFLLLQKALKQIGLYRHATAQYGEFLKNAFGNLSDLLEQHESITLVVEQMSFKHAGQVVYQEEANELNLAFKFYRDGIRLLIFRKGLAADELLNFILVCLTNFKQAEFAQEDMGSLMWQKDFTHIEHVIMESFALGSDSGEETNIEVDKIVNYMVRGLSSQSSDSTQQARLSLDDLEIEIQDIEQVAGLAVKGDPVSPADQVQIQFQVEQDVNEKLLPTFLRLLLRILEQETLDDALMGVLGSAFEQLLDGFLLQENLAAIEGMMGGLAASGQKPLHPQSQLFVDHLLRTLTERMSDPERVERLGERMETAADEDSMTAVRTYLDRLDERALGPLLGILERITRPEGRALLVEKLASFGQAHLEHYVNRLKSPKANFVRDLLAIINRLQPEGKTKILAGLLSHPNLAIRVEVLNAIGDGHDLTGSAYVIRALKDSDPQVRATAARLLPNFDTGVALRALLAVVNEPVFDDKPGAEQVAVFAALAMTDAPEAMDFFRRQLQAGGFLQKKHLAERKKNVVTGMVNSGSIAAYRLLAEELKSGIKDKEFAALVQRAVARMKQRLLGA